MWLYVKYVLNKFTICTLINLINLNWFVILILKLNCKNIVLNQSCSKDFRDGLKRFYAIFSTIEHIELSEGSLKTWIDSRHVLTFLTLFNQNTSPRLLMNAYLHAKNNELPEEITYQKLLGFYQQKKKLKPCSGRFWRSLSTIENVLKYCIGVNTKSSLQSTKSQKTDDWIRSKRISTMYGQMYR